jgi:2,4-dienoyl-CoA reductase-like NADH-dependent reductase (Old Yellow Enzyme family)
MIDQPVQADTIIREGQADMVALGRALLADPRWPWRAAARLGHEFHATPQLARSAALMKQWGSAA